MNQYQQQLWNDLMALTSEVDSPFYFKDFENPPYHVTKAYYRIFNYRLASYTDFLKPSALECRGTMFEIDEKGNPYALACLPMSKFFNLNENPLVMNLDLSPGCIAAINTKMDGSLISTFWAERAEGMGIKSKGSLNSTQVEDALKLLLQDPSKFLWELGALTEDGYTVNMEYVAPTNRIVIGYTRPDLVVLSVRCRKTGLTFYKDWPYLANYPAIRERWVKYHDVNDTGFSVNDVEQEQGIEGYVVRLNSGMLFKTKTIWYVTLHHTKDSINSPRRLFECVINETVDDLRAMFSDDPVAIMMIDEMQKRVNPKFSQIINVVENFYEQNKELIRKDYAIKGQTISDGLFGLKMNKYLGKPVDYKEFAIKHPEMFGVKQDEEQRVVGEE